MSQTTPSGTDVLAKPYLAKPYGVACIGHTWATCPVWFATIERAIECAEHMAPDAMRTTVYDCTSGPVGTPILVIGG